jgi:sodium/hydrogen antiporter
VITALAGWLLLGFHPAAAAILGAALASTDPVLLRTVLRSRALPDAPRLALRLETGMNDVVLLPIVVLSMLLLPREGGLGVTSAMDEHVGRSLLALFVLGPVLGAAVGWVGITALGVVRGHTGVRRDYESLYALGLAFTSFAAAEAVGGSGFVAAFAAGLLVASRDVELCDCFLEYGEATAEMLLLLTFVALGMSLIWLGLGELDWRTIAFVGVALVARPAVLYPVLGGVGLDVRERRLVAAFGPRGLSSLLLALLPVFAGIPGAERIFTVAAVVVLASVVVHGGGAAFYLRRHTRAGTGGPVAPPMPLRRATPVAASALPVDVRAENRPGLITIKEMQALEARGEPVVIVDARADRNRDGDPLQATGSVRVRPDDPVRDATELRLSQRATLVVYCA